MHMYRPCFTVIKDLQPKLNKRISCGKVCLAISLQFNYKLYAYDVN
jgi:hypothetical protein